MEKFYLFISSFLAIYLLYLVTVVLNKKKIGKFSESSQFLYFKKVYKIDSNKINIKKIANTISLSNAFIMASAIIVVDYIDNVLLKMVGAFLFILPLMAIIYHLIGKRYQGK